MICACYKVLHVPIITTNQITCILHVTSNSCAVYTVPRTTMSCDMYSQCATLQCQLEADPESEWVAVLIPRPYVHGDRTPGTCLILSSLRHDHLCAGEIGKLGVAVGAAVEVKLLAASLVSSWAVQAPIVVGRPMSCVPGYFEVINTHTVGSLTIPRASIKWV